ncbi:hypothetical protein P7F88_19370 [Vibrio hannami]|uniref:hypothetical protein n=1 Tax=Vibrio hannami TaxID=2717094 RepID=UPI00240EA1EC|nr:hypothetical protein [Vibrio hannami]MDG3088117.1 hypothetical protein [Vibrio hannami]
MAINPDDSINARHVLYCAGTGGGKTTAMHQADKLGLIPLNEDVMIFDTYSTFTRLGKRKVYQAAGAKEFISKMAKLRAQPKPFVISYVGRRTLRDFEFFQKLAWQFADGKRPLHIINEELIRFVTTISKAEGQLAENYQGGRKFGLVCHSIFQRGQEVPKTILRGSQIKWVGKQDDFADAEYWSKRIDIATDDIAGLVDLEYYIKRQGINNVVRGKLEPIFS